jgi:hypothetical protein
MPRTIKLLCKQFLLVALGSQISSFLLLDDAGAACSPDSWKPPVETGGTGVQALLRDIPLHTKWVDVPPETKAQLQLQAEKRLSAYRARWAGAALAAKQTILLECPTAEMLAAMDEFYRKSYDSLVSPTFSLSDVKNPELKRALIRGYLAGMAAFRANITYPDQKLPNHDWDGISVFDSVRLPDQQSYLDIRHFGMAVASDLRGIDDATLVDAERRLKARALFDMRAIALGGFSSDSKGGFDMESACEMVALDADVVMGYKAEKGRPRIFANDDEALREVNAIYLPSTSLKWLDVGTLEAALKLSLCNWSEGDVEQYVGDPATNEVARGFKLLKSWWIERASASAAAKNRCSVYSATDRAQIWEAFSADQQFNNDGSFSMEGYKSQLEAYRDGKLAQYRPLAKLALQLVFPDSSVLTDTQRAQVLAAIDAETTFGQFQNKIAKALDVVQGTTGKASKIWQAAFENNVARFGGGYSDGAPVRPDDEAAIKAMFDEVKAWVSNRYRGYPIEIGSFVDTIKFTVNTKNNAETKLTNGDITFGVGTQRSKMEFYSLLLHELRHAVVGGWRSASPDKSKVVVDEGTAVEGSGVAVEELLLGTFLKETLKNDLAYALYSLDYGIRDARFTGTTDATLQKYFRSGCAGDNDTNTLEFAKGIAANYGLTGGLADNLALRAHAGTQYFQYISAGVQIVGDIRYLQDQIDPSASHPIDPYVLFACGLNTPRRDVAYVAALKACVKL